MDNKLKDRLLEDVVIFSDKHSEQTGAKSLAPDHSPREPYRARPVPVRGLEFDGTTVGGVYELHAAVAQFLNYQAELLDTKNWAAYIDLFDDAGVYWMPARPEQTEWLDSPSIFAEDRSLMSVRMGRLMHPNAWSQAPLWETSHLVGGVAIEAKADGRVEVRSRFQALELRRDQLRHFAGTYRHTLRHVDDEFKIQLQRVDLINARAPFDYTIQAWV